MLAMRYSNSYTSGQMQEGLPWKTPDDGELEQYADRTRRSLIARLQNWEDRRSWDEFYRTYWRLIYSVATKAGLRDDEAWDTVQETILSIAKQSKEKGYDPQKGSFKQWLWNLTRWRIADTLRNRTPETAPTNLEENTYTPTAEELPDLSNEFDSIWEKEWQRNLIKAATERVKMQVKPLHFQIFDYSILRGMGTLEVRRKLGVSIAQIYLARHRVSSMLKKEIEELRKKGE